MTPDLISLLIQIPIVGIFIWYSLETNKRNSESQQKFILLLQDQHQKFLEALDKRDAAFENRNKAVLSILIDHDKKTDAAIATMYERTRDARDEDTKPRRRTAP